MRPPSAAAAHTPRLKRRQISSPVHPRRASHCPVPRSTMPTITPTSTHVSGSRKGSAQDDASTTSRMRAPVSKTVIVPKTGHVAQAGAEEGAESDTKQTEKTAFAPYVEAEISNGAFRGKLPAPTDSTIQNVMIHPARVSDG